MITNFKIYEGETFSSIIKTINDYNKFIDDIEPFLEKEISTPFNYISITEIKVINNDSLIFFVTAYDNNYEPIESLDIHITNDKLKDLFIKIDQNKYNL